MKPRIKCPICDKEVVIQCEDKDSCSYYDSYWIIILMNKLINKLKK